MRKTTKRFLSWKYDQLFKKASRIIVSAGNLCDFQDGVCIEIRTRREHGWTETNNSCCGKCKHLSESGCMVQCVGCRAFLCGTMRDSRPEVYRQLNRVMSSIKSHGFFGYFQSKEETFERSVEQRYKDDSLIKALYGLYAIKVVKFLHWCFRYVRYRILKYVQKIIKPKRERCLCRPYLCAKSRYEW